MKPLLGPPGRGVNCPWKAGEAGGAAPGANDRDVFFRAETLALAQSRVPWRPMQLQPPSPSVSQHHLQPASNSTLTCPLTPAAMDTGQVMDMVNLLDDQVDDIEEALAPLLKETLQDTAATLPVVDKARLYVLTTYAIDSLLFCTCPPPSLQAPSLTISSISQTPWRQRPRTPRHARTRARQTVRQEDQRSAGHYNRGEA